MRFQLYVNMIIIDLRDINPYNFLVGLGKKADKIYMIDYG